MFKFIDEIKSEEKVIIEVSKSNKYFAINNNIYNIIKGHEDDDTVTISVDKLGRVKLKISNLNYQEVENMQTGMIFKEEKNLTLKKEKPIYINKGDCKVMSTNVIGFVKLPRVKEGKKPNVVFENYVKKNIIPKFVGKDFSNREEIKTYWEKEVMPTLPVEHEGDKATWRIEDTNTDDNNYVVFYSLKPAGKDFEHKACFFINVYNKREETK